MQYDNLGFALDRAVAAYPDRPFMVDATTTLTYAEVGSRVGSVTTWLLAQGVTRGVVVGAVVTNRPEYIEMLLACARIGAVIVPLNYRHSKLEVASLLERVQPRVVLLDEDFVEAHIDTVVALGATCVGLGPANPRAVSYAEVLETDLSGAPVEPWRDLDPDDIQAIHFTSGTTGRAKGVQRSHAANIAMALGSLAAMPVRSDDAWLYALPPHSAGFYGLAVPALFTGGRLVLCAKFDPVEFAAAARKHRVTHTMLAPTMWQMLADSSAAVPADFESLRYAVWGGMPMSEHTFDLLEKLLPVPCTGGYGMTECTCIVWSTEHLYRSGRRRSSGYPSPSMQVRIVDPEGAAVSSGDTGEVLLRGQVVMSGYLGDPDLTRQVLDDDGWLHTGDVGWLDGDGALTVVDRAKDMIITGAENVFPSEVESVLARMDGVHEVAVVGIEHPTWGQQVAAAIVSDAPVSLDMVAAHCRTLGLADYKRPRLLLRLDELPKNNLGKVERFTLIELMTKDNR